MSEPNEEGMSDGTKIVLWTFAFVAFLMFIAIASPAPVPKEARTDDDVWAWYRDPKFDEKWMTDKEFNRLFQRGVDAGFFYPVGGLYLYATDKPSMRFRKWWLESYRTLPGCGPALLPPFANTPLIWPGWPGTSKEDYKSWD